MAEKESTTIKFDSIDSTVKVSEEPEKEKKQLTERQKFWIRMALYVIFGLILPCAFIIWRCDLFGGKPVTLGFWGFIVILIVTLFSTSCLRWLRKGLKFCMIKQVIDGFIKIILPLTTVLLFVVVIKDNVDLIIQCLGCIIACELVAIPLNPICQWYYKSKGEEMEGVMDMAIDKYFTRKKEEEKK